MDLTPYKPPPFPSGASTRHRRQLYAIEDVQLFEEMIAVLTIALSDPTRAGILMNDIATRQLLPTPVESFAATPIRSQLRGHTSRSRFTPYNTERRTRQNLAPSMFDTRNLQHVSPPITPQRQNEHYPPASHSRSLDYATPSRSTDSAGLATPSHSTDSLASFTRVRSTTDITPTVTPLRQAQHPYPGILSRVRNLPNFEHLHAKPCLRLVRCDTSVVELSSPRHCIFDESRREWIIADKDLGILFLNKDCFQILRSIPGFYEPCATVLLNDGNHLGILDNRGIFIYDMQTNQKCSIFSLAECRGLAVTATGDFVTLNPIRRCIYLVPQNGDKPVCYPYQPPTSQNYEGLPSAASSINVSENRLVIVDYTIGSLSLYKLDPYTRELNFVLHQDCTKGVPLCRLTGGFMDQKGRIIASNCKERICMLFDYDGKFIQRVPCDDGFPRSQYLCVNKDFQAVVLDTLQKPHTARLYRIIADPRVLKDDFPISKHPTPIYAKEFSNEKPPMPSTSDVYQQSYQSPSAHYLEPGEIENTIADCKGLIAEITLDDRNEVTFGGLNGEITLDE